MIESWYWKEDLLAHARRLQPKRKPPRWSERAVVNFEKELMVSFFMVRALLERNKVSSKSKNYAVPVRKAPWNGKRVTQMNYWCVDEIYHLDQEVEERVSLPFLANQFVHCRVIYAMRDETRNWSDVLLCSDYETRKAIYRVSVSEIRSILLLVGTDYTRWSRMVYDPKIDDYRVTVG
jgi:hypothetical protein